MNLSEKNNHFK